LTLSLFCAIGFIGNLYYFVALKFSSGIALSKDAKGRTRESVDLLIVNAEELLTLANGGQKPRIGPQMHELGIVRDGALAIKEGRIVAVGKTRDVTKAFRAENVISAKGKVVLPASSIRIPIARLLQPNAKE